MVVRKGAVMTEWKTIETAPVGVPMLVTDGKIVVAGVRGKLCGEPWLDPHGFGGYEWEWEFGQGGEWTALTHWMPLPEVPKP